MTSLGSTCYCYNEDCNQKEWERRGLQGKRQFTVVSDIAVKGGSIPRCPYCKEEMTVTASLNHLGDYDE